MIPVTLSRLWWHRFLRREARPWDELEKFPALSPTEQRLDLGRRLLNQIRYFGKREDALPEWKDAARISDPDELFKVWPNLPIITRSDLQHRFPAAEIAARFGLDGRMNSSGGSTGEPVQFFHDWEMARSGLAASTYTRVRMGCPLGTPCIILWGSERDIGKQSGWKDRLHGQLRNESLVDGYQMSDASVNRVLELARRDRPVAFWGFTSILEFVARRVVETGQCLEPGIVRTAWNGGEMLFPEQCEIFKKAFGVPILNRYGGRELSAMACQYEEGGPLHVLRPWLFLEVVNSAGKPAAPGESGRLIWTSTVCRGTPFLRYEIGDMGVYSASHAGEAGITAIQEISGRIASLLELPDGRTINNLYWNHLFKAMPEVQQFQVILKKDGSVNLLLKGSGFSEEQERELRGMFRHLLGEIPVRLSWVESIPPTRQGKLIQVVRES